MNTTPFPPHLLPETQQYLAREQQQIQAVTEGLLATFHDCQVHPQVALSALASTMLTLLARLEPTDVGREALASGLRGFTDALLAYCAAPDCRRGSAALDVVVAASNRRQFGLIDDQIATRVPPKA